MFPIALSVGLGCAVLAAVVVAAIVAWWRRQQKESTYSVQEVSTADLELSHSVCSFFETESILTVPTAIALTKGDWDFLRDE
jgi:uncharacterized membrane-anchored protein